MTTHKNNQPIANTHLKNYGLPFEEVVELAQDLGVTEFVLEKFFKLLQQQNILYEDCFDSLYAIARLYLNLLHELSCFQAADLEVKMLLNQIQEVLQRGEFELAEELINRVKEKYLGVAKKTSEAVNHSVLSVAAEVAAHNAKLKLAQMKYVEAAEYFQEAAEIVPAEFSEKLVDYLTNAASAWQNAKRYADAESLYVCNLAILENILGKSHHLVVNALSNLADFYQRQGRDSEAELLYQRVSEIHCKRSLLFFEQFLGSNHPTTQSVRHYLETLRANKH